MTNDSLQGSRLPWFLVALTGIVVGLGYFYQALFVSLILGVFFAYLLSPVADWVTGKLVKKRVVAILLLLAIVFFSLSILVASMIPVLYHQGAGLVKLLPGAYQLLLEKLVPVQQFLVERGILADSGWESLMSRVDVVETLGAQARGAIDKIWDSTPRVLGGVINFFLIPVVSFFLLAESVSIKKGVRSITPPAIHNDLSEYIRKLDKTLKSVLKGQLMVAATLGGLYIIGFSAIGLKFAAGVGAIAGLCRLVPYFDIIVGVVLSAIVGLTQGYGWGMFMAAGLVIAVVQVIDGMVITPRILGERAGLHPGLVIVSIIAFADWFGLLGVLIAVPILAVLKVTAQTFMPLYTSSGFFKNP